MTPIKVTLELDDGTFTTRILRAGKSVEDLAKQVGSNVVAVRNAEQSYASLGTTVQRVVAGFGLATAAFAGIKFVATDVVAGIVRVNAEIERLQVQMRAMSGASDPIKEAGDNVKYLRDMAREAPFSLQSLASAFTMLKATGIDPAKGAMQGLVNAAAASGATEEGLKRAATAISQMSGKGVIQMEELRQQLGEAIPRSAELMARALGMSYSQLVEAVGKGTLAAKPALEALNAEFQRTFGGAATQLMQTFNGQLQRTKSLFQDFALEVGKTGAFDELKRKLTEFNDLLASDRAQVFARMVGQGFLSLMNAAETALQTIIQFRFEILAAGQALAVAFGAGLVLQGLRSIGGGIQSLIVNTAAANNNLDRYIAASKASAVASIAAGSASTVMANGFHLARVAVVGFGTALSVALPIIPLLGAAVVVVASYFDLFGSKTKSAWQELETFGVVTKDAISAAEGALKKEREELAKLEATRNRLANQKGPYLDGMSKDDRLANYDKMIGQKREDLAKKSELLTRRNAEFEAGEAQRVSAIKMRALDEEITQKRQELDREGKDLAQAYDNQVREYAKNRQSTEKIDEDYRRKEKDRQVRAYDIEIKALEEHYRNISQLQEKELGSVARQANDKTQAEITKRLAETYRQRAEAIKQTIGPQTLEKGVDIEGLITKGTKALENLKAEAAGTRAELNGASNEAAKLAYQLVEGMKYGDPRSAQVQELIENLLKAQAEVSALDELLQGKKDLDQQITSALIRNQNEIIENQNKNAGEYEKIVARIKAGMIKGYTIDKDGKIRAELDAMRQGFTGANQAANPLAARLSSIFGGTALDSAKNYQSVIEKVAEALGRVGAAANGINLNGTFPGGAGGGSGFSFNGGAVPGSFVDKVVGVESGGNPNAKNDNSSATGAGQFIMSTWMQFLNEMRPDLVAAQVAGRDFRRDMEISKQAVAWYASKNAAYLEKNSGGSVKPTDANLYLAHFLGPVDALKVLTSNMMTRVESIVNKGSVDANRSILQGKTVADVIAWANRKMGGGQSYEGNTASLSQTRGGQGPEGARQTSRLVELAESDAMRKLSGYTRTLADDLEEVTKRGDKAARQLEGLGKEEAKITAGIMNGRYGETDADKDPRAERYKAILEAARAADREADAFEKREQARAKGKRALDSRSQRQEDLNDASAEARARLSNPNRYNESSATSQLENQLRRETQAIKAAYGEQSREYQDALQENGRILDQHIRTEIEKKSAGGQEEINSLRQSLMTQSQARQAALQERIAQIDAEVAAYQAAGGKEVAVVQRAEEQKRLLRQQAAADGPLAKQMKEWSDFGGNMEKAMTGWLDGATDALANFITTGKMDFKALADQILKDMTRIALRAMMSGMKGGPGAGAKGAAGAGKSGGKSMPFMTAHTGGIIGSSFLRSSNVNPMAFAGAPRFHTGGIISGLGIGPDEVPAILKKGEGVFTPEQMAAMGGMGGGQQINQSVNVTVNGNGGDPAQNQDLAARIGRQVKEEMRGMVGQEIRQQMRPGGMMNR